MRVIAEKISRTELKKIAELRFGDLVKAVVDAEKKIMAIGGELHSDEEGLLIIVQGSRQQDLWGINLYPDRSAEEMVEFDSMINIRPNQGNRSRGVDDENIRKAIMEIVMNLVEEV
ncbi:hypothetical protein HZB94_03690 [Candidatus Falkowbacteria bacterium]|nr:hypothetical protein [Candidatus Falkowbacteria bacterium]